MLKQFVFLLLSLVVVATGCNSTQSNTYHDEIINHRKEVNKEFLDASKSPLLKEDRAQFTSLNYFPIDSTYKVRATIQRHSGKQPFQMPTSTDRLPWYQHVATLTFTVKDSVNKLDVYKNLDNKLDTTLFIPFGDGTNGLTSYGSGRYLDINLPAKSNEIQLDFNKAYNPYCAYNHKFSCPIPPKSNQLEVYILAGEKVFKQY